MRNPRGLIACEGRICYDAFIKKRMGTLICMFLGGPIIDGFTYVLADYINDSLPVGIRLSVLVAGCIILTIGMKIVIKSEAGTGPNDLYRERLLPYAESICKSF